MAAREGSSGETADAWRSVSAVRMLSRAGVPGAGALRVPLIVVAAACLANFLALALPLTALQVYDRIIPNDAVATLAALTLGLFGVALIEFALRVGQGVILSAAALRYAQALQLEACRRVLHADDAALEAIRGPKTRERFAAVERLADYLGGRARLGLVDLPFSFLFLAMIAVIGGPVVLAPVLVFGAFVVVMALVSRRARAVTRERDRHDAKTSDFLAELFGASQMIKSFSLEALMMRRFERLLKQSAELKKAMIGAASDLRTFSATFGNISMVATLCVGALMVMDGALTIGGLAACSLLSGRAIQPLMQAASSAHERENAAAAIQEIAPLFELAPAAAKDPAASGAPQARPPGVTADGLTVLRDGRVLLENAAFDIEPGAFAFLIDTADGAAQAVQRMASGLRPAPGGALLVNGADPAAFRAGPRARAAFVSADSAPLNGTILENLTLFGRGASVDDARAAAQLLDLERVINRLPEGYDTRMASSGGATLPAGIVHSILLARAIAQRPLLLAAHRPFAYLDATAERRTLQALKALRDRCTVLVSSNRTQFAAHADLVLSFENGRCLSRAPLSFRAPRPEDGATGGEDATAAGAPPAATGGAA